MASSIPIIDLGPFTLPNYTKLTKQDVIDAVAEANSVFGCFYLINHGVDRRVVDAHVANLREFFAQPIEYKNRYVDPAGDPNRGYIATEKQNVHESMGRYGLPGDAVEKYVFRPPISDPADIDQLVVSWPDIPSSYKHTVTEYYRALRNLSSTLMRVFSLALNVPGYETFFYEQLRTGAHRLKNHLYPPTADGVRKPGQEDRLAAHTDFGPMAILATDSCQGALQVWVERDNEWVNVNPIEDAFVVNLGEPMARWTNGRWIAPMHKVAWPEKPEIKGRISAVYFPHAASDIVLKPIPELVPAGQKPLYEPISYRDFANQKIRNSY